MIYVNDSARPGLLFYILIVACFAIAVDASAQTNGENAAFDSVKMVKEIAAGNKVFIEALSKLDSLAVANYYSEDARILNSGNPSTIGRTGVLHFMVI